LLIIDEEEQFVLLNGPADSAAHLILVQHLPYAATITIVKKGVGVEIRIAEEFPHVAMELIAAGARDHVHVGAGVRTVAGVVRGSLNLELLNGVGIGDSDARVDAT